MGPAAAVAEVRNAVRACVSDLAAGDLVLAACSGGADSLALAAALAFVAPRAGLRGGGVTVDHGLQPGSAERAAEVSALLGGLGLDPVRAVTVRVAAPGSGGGPRPRPGRPGTPRCRTPPRNAGPPRSCSVTPWTTRPRPSCSGSRADPAAAVAGRDAARRRGPYRRPLLAVRRATISAACAEPGCAPVVGPAQRGLPLRPRPRSPSGLPAARGGDRAGGGGGAGPDREPARVDADASMISRSRRAYSFAAAAPTRPAWPTAGCVSCPPPSGRGWRDAADHGGLARTAPSPRATWSASRAW